MSSRIPEPESAYEAEGLAEPDDLPEKEITGDAQEGIPAPGDVPLAADDYGTTAAEQAAGEPLALRLTREEPDVLDAADLPVGEGAGADQPFRQGVDAAVGRIIEPDEGARSDHEPDAVAVDVGTDRGGFTAEEAAMHVEPET